MGDSRIDRIIAEGEAETKRRLEVLSRLIAGQPMPVECDLCGWTGRRVKARSRPCPSCGHGKVQFR